MKRFIAIFVLLAAIGYTSLVVARMTVTTVGGGVPAAGDAYTDIVFFWRCEGTTLDTGDCYGTDNTATGNSSAAINTAAANIGTNGFDSPTANDYFLFDNNAEYVGAEGRFGAWVRVTAFVNNAVLFICDTDGDNFVSMRLSGTDNETDRELTARWKGNNTEATAIVTTTADIAEGTWFFLEYAWKQATNYREVFINGTSVGSSSAAMTAFNPTPTNVYFGDTDAASNNDVHYDNIILSNSSTRNLYLLRNLTACPK